jgi:hypothetical protein
MQSAFKIIVLVFFLSALLNGVTGVLAQMIVICLLQQHFII